MSDLKEIRVVANQKLDEGGQSERVDSRSLLEQASAALERAKAALAQGDAARSDREVAEAERLMSGRPQTHMGPTVWNMEERALAKAQKAGASCRPVTDRMRQALEAGRAPEPFASAYKAQIAKGA